MKKGLLGLVLILSIFSMLTIPKTKAVEFTYTEVDLLDNSNTPNITYDFGEIPAGFDNAGNMNLAISGYFPCTYDLRFYPAIASYIKVVLPLEDWYENVLGVAFADDINTYSETGTLTTFSIYQYQNERSYKFDLIRPFFGDDVSDTGEFVFYIEFNFDYDTPPEPDFQNYFIANSEAKFGFLLTYYEIYIKEYEQWYLHTMIPKGWGSIPTETEIDLPEFSNRLFIGFQTEDGSYIRLKNITESLFVEGEGGEPTLRLYANYMYIAGTIPPTTQTPETTVLGEILAMFQGNNTFGFVLIFFIITVASMFIFVWKAWPIFGYIAIHLVLTIVFWVLQLLPIYVIIVNILIYAIGIILTIKKNQSLGGGESE